MTYLMEIKRQRKDAAKKAQAETEEKTKLDSIRKMMQKLNLTAKQAMDILDIPINEQNKYAAQV